MTHSSKREIRTKKNYTGERKNPSVFFYKARSAAAAKFYEAAVYNAAYNNRNKYEPSTQSSALKKAETAAAKGLKLVIKASGILKIKTVLIILLISAAVSVCTVLYMSLSPLSAFLITDETNTASLKNTVKEINEEFSSLIISCESQYGDVEIRGERASWKDMLCVYFALEKDNENINYVNLTDDNIDSVRQIFNAFNEIKYLSEDGKAVLEISALTLEEAENIYGFDEEKKEYVSYLKNSYFDDAWDQLLRGTYEDIVAAARSQVGYTGGEKYWRWYGFDERVEWCACFVSWCADCGCAVSDGEFKKFDNCQIGLNEFQKRNLVKGESYIPVGGEIIFFDWDNDDIADHVGIIEKCDGEYIYTIEGNVNDEVKRGAYEIKSGVICAVVCL